jgi:hypothetical protein
MAIWNGGLLDEWYGLTMMRDRDCVNCTTKIFNHSRPICDFYLFNHSRIVHFWKILGPRVLCQCCQSVWARSSRRAHLFERLIWTSWICSRLGVRSFPKVPPSPIQFQWKLHLWRSNWNQTARAQLLPEGRPLRRWYLVWWKLLHDDENTMQRFDDIRLRTSPCWIQRI